MHYKVIELELKRTVRHKQYVVDTPGVKLIAHLDKDDMDQLNEVVEEMRGDLHLIMEREVRLCKQEFEESKNA